MTLIDKRNRKLLIGSVIGILGSMAVGVSLTDYNITLKSIYTGATMLSIRPAWAAIPLVVYDNPVATYKRFFITSVYGGSINVGSQYDINVAKHIITLEDGPNGMSVLVGYAYGSQVGISNAYNLGLAVRGNILTAGTVYAKQICFHDGTSVVKCIDASGVTTENSNLQINWTSGKIRSKKGYEIDLDHGIARLKKVEDDSGVFYIDLSNGDASISTIYQSKIISVNMNDNKTYTVDPAGSSTMYKLEVKKFSLLSDARLKDIVGYYNNVLEYYPYLYAVKFKWKNDKDNNIYVGVIAQNIMKYFPELVKKDSNGYYTVSYEGLTAINTEAIKELYEKYQKLKEENEQLKAKIEELEKEVEELKSLVEGK